LNEKIEPYILYTSNNFLKGMEKAYNLGLLPRKPFLQILKKMNIQFNELDRENAKKVLEELSAKGMTVSTAQLIKSLTLALFTPTTLFYAMLKKVMYIEGAHLEDCIIMHLLAEIPRAFRPTLFYHIWITVPLNEEGEKKSKQIFKNIKEKVNVEPINEKEWDELKPIIDKISPSLNIKGVSQNLWPMI
jgi:hypothetical protein